MAGVFLAFKNLSDGFPKRLRTCSLYGRERESQGSTPRQRLRTEPVTPAGLPRQLLGLTLPTTEVQYLFMCSFAVYIFPLVKTTLKSFAHFLTGLCVVFVSMVVEEFF